MAHPEGVLKAKGRYIRPLPKRGKRVYLLTCAQNNTGLHEAAWQNLLALAAHDGAEILVSQFTYAVSGRASLGQKVSRADTTSREAKAPVEVWDERLEPYISNDSVQLAPGLIWCGEMQILPTAVNPLSGFQSYTGAASSIFPHVTFALESVAAPKRDGAKFLYTTGAVTLRNYIEKKAGQKASFHHGYGALLVEVLPDGTWFARHLNADSEGVIYDLDRRITSGKVTQGHRPAALVWGDIHTRHLELWMRELAWGVGGILDTLRPERQVMHDVLDFRSQNHHDRGNPWKTFEKHVAGGLSVADEVAELAGFLKLSARRWCETAVVAANHDEALMRWLRDADFRTDPLNALFMLEASMATYAAIKRGDSAFYPLEWAVNRHGKAARVRWLRRDDTYAVRGVECDMHGDIGANGSRGGLAGYARSGRRSVTAHTHTAGLRQGAMSVGVMANLDQGYNAGPSSWSQTFALILPNGKRQLITVRNRRWRA